METVYCFSYDMNVSSKPIEKMFFPNRHQNIPSSKWSKMIFYGIIHMFFANL
ncbi:hypothetical protein B4090_3361 [Bacillus licheniformis]|nr:hypothetical protein B4090_3361 [Bacillus licheniformis]OLF86191.1 hypothetical protein B4094_4655 [Bacillus licheniformis]TWK53639.1 hypothetical protein CHCC20344_3854 [Bacillus licheniformis]TWK97935.1 hypothetical protein CHCC20327_2731 [Bacillus licheniformis]TWM02670.1 hypothetical protein CHCC15139_1564 [Bacillus licheniformis]